MNNKDCDMVQDLLPNYIEHLTSDKTNNFINKHLNECTKCSNVYENMERQDNIYENNKCFIDFAKIYKQKLTILKMILLIIFIVFIVIIIKKLIIIASIVNKVEKYTDINNFYSKYVQYNEDNITVIESYNKENKYLKKLENIYYDNSKMNNKIIEFYDGVTLKIFIENSEEKKVILGETTSTIMPIELKSYYIPTNNIIDFIRNVIFSNIKTSYCNGVECYRFTDLCNSQIYNSKDNNYVYIEKSTGLPVRALGGTIISDSKSYDIIQDFYYEINTVSDEDLIEPRIEEYKIIK